MKIPRGVIIAIYIVIGYFWIWGSIWWFPHLAEETWIGVGQAVTNILLWVGYLAMWLGTLDHWEREDRRKRDN